MVFEVAPTRVGRGHGRWPVLVVAGIAAAVIAAAVIGGDSNPSPPWSDEAVAAVPSSTQPAPAPTRADVASLLPSSSPDPRPTTAAITCDEGAATVCTEVVVAGLVALPDDVPHPVSAEVWASLFCGDDLDCPRSEFDRMAGTMGSVKFGFDTGPSAWVNVIHLLPDAGAGPDPAGAEPDPVVHAWIARWVPQAPIT